MVHVNHHHHPAHEAREANPDVATAVSVVYVTASKTFPGPIAGYNTPTVSSSNNNEPNFFDGGNAQSAPMATDTQAAVASSILPLTVPSAAAASSAPMIMASQNPVQSSPLPSQVVAAPSSALSSDVSQQTTLAQAVSPSAASSVAAPTDASLADVQSAPTASPAPEQTNSSGGMSSGGKAGLAIGIIAIIAILSAVGFFFYRRKQNNAAHAQQLDNEKSNAAGGMARAASMSAPVAPRLSNKAENNALPEMNEKQAAMGGIDPVAAPTMRGRTPEPQPSERTNPFGDHAKVPETAVAPAPLTPKPLNVQHNTSPRPSTSGSDKSASSATSAAAVPKGPDGQPLNVHRVQLDFAPSMDDELELRQGQLVRMLHEYDDGWCLCVRLDRSQQGVTPRSCISKMPVKPRPGPPPGKNGSRPTTPQGAQSAVRARANSNVPAPLNTGRPAAPQGPFGEGEYRARSNTGGGSSPTPSYDASNLSNSPNHSPPSSPESKQLAHKPTGPGQAV